ncbi:MAG: chemotaxis protein CheX [Bacillota bacterium]
MDTRLYSPFINSIKDVFKQMTGIEVYLDKDFYTENDDLVSLGVTSIISFSGKIKGRLLLDMEKSLALEVAKNITGTDFDNVKEYMVLASVQELNNIISGDAITKLNNEFGVSLRLAPPIVFAGKDAVVSVPKVEPVSMDCGTSYGKLKVNIAFEEGGI